MISESFVNHLLFPKLNFKLRVHPSFFLSVITQLPQQPTKEDPFQLKPETNGSGNSACPSKLMSTQGKEVSFKQESKHSAYFSNKHSKIGASRGLYDHCTRVTQNFVRCSTKREKELIHKELKKKNTSFRRSSMTHLQ